MVTCVKESTVDVDISKGKIDDLMFAVDSTGIKMTNRGQQTNEKWNIQTKKETKKYYLKIHTTIDIMTNSCTIKLSTE